METKSPMIVMPGDPGVLGQVWRIFSKKQRAAFILLVIGAVVGALLETGAVGLMLPFMNTIMDIDTIEGSSWRIIIYRLFGCSSTEDLLITIAVLIAVMYFTKGVYRFLFRYYQARVFTDLRTSLSIRLFDTLMHKPYHFHLHTNTAHLQRIVTMDVERVFILVNNLMTMISEGAVAVGIMVLLLAVDPLMAIGCIVLVLSIMLITNNFVMKRIRRNGQSENENNTAMLRWVQQAMGGLKGIYTSRRQDYFIGKYAKHARGTAKSAAGHNVLQNTPKELVEMLTMMSIFLFMAVIVSRGRDLERMLPMFATFALAAVRILPVANRVTSSLAEINYKRHSLSQVYHTIADNDVDLDHDGMAFETQLSRPIPKVDPLKDGIRIEHLRFGYADAEHDLFTDLSLEIPACKSVAFIGVTGSGKTTLADLLLGLHTPLSGSVTADGHDIHEDPDWWADRVGYIPQMIYLCDDTIRKNVAFGFDEKDIDDARIWHCLEEAQMKEFVESLPDGLDTVTGENGVRLSGGQRQRIGIARALYADPPFLVMDEATSALDNETEQAIIESVNRLAGKKTLLIIAHRLTTIEDCDIVYRIENGTATQVDVPKGN